MNEKIKKIQEALENNPELKKQLSENPPKTSEELIALAKQFGVELTEDDLKAAQELSDEDLEKLAGGMGCFNPLLMIFEYIV